MSRGPNKEGILCLKDNLRDYRSLCKRIGEIREMAKELPELEARADQKHKCVLLGLEAMDVASNGNFGWGNRMVMFLAELERLASESE